MYQKDYTEEVLRPLGPPKFKFGKKPGPPRYTNKGIVPRCRDLDENMELDLETLSKLPKSTTPQGQPGALPKLEKQASGTSNIRVFKIFREVLQNPKHAQ